MSGRSLHVLQSPPSPDARREQFSVRVDKADKAKFSAAAKQCGLDPSIAARCVLELIVQRLDRGENLLEILREFQSSSSKTLDEEIK